jgi:hypothetical protein
MVNFAQCELVGAQASTERTLSFVLDFYKKKDQKSSVCDPPLAGLAQSFYLR